MATQKRTDMLKIELGPKQCTVWGMKGNEGRCWETDEMRQGQRRRTHLPRLRRTYLIAIRTPTLNCLGKMRSQLHAAHWEASTSKFLQEPQLLCEARSLLAQKNQSKITQRLETMKK